MEIKEINPDEIIEKLSKIIEYIQNRKKRLERYDAEEFSNSS